MTIQEFFDKYNGKGIDFDGAFGNQCVDLYRQYAKEVAEAPQSPPVRGAADIWDTYLSKHFERVKNTPTGVPQKGDIVIWNKKSGGGYGHVAIFSQGNTKSFTSFDQNWPVGSVCHFEGHYYTNVLGWLRPKKPKGVRSDMTQDQKNALGVLKTFKEADKQLKKGNLEGASRAATEAYSLVEGYKKSVETADEKCEKRVLSALDKQNASFIREKLEIEAKWQSELKSAKSSAEGMGARFLSRKWLLTLLGVAVPLLNAQLGLDLSIEVLAIILSPIISFIVVEGVKDAKRA